MGIDTNCLVEVQNIHKRFDGEEILRNVSLGIAPGELTLVTGPSGSGKTTLLNIMGTLEHPDSGNVQHDGKSLVGMTKEEATRWRALYTGFAFQRSGLLNGMTVRENILAPHALSGKAIDSRWAGSLCLRLGIADLLDTKSSRLSGGEKQRVALARALVHEPQIVFADEPSAPLDTNAKIHIHEMMRDLVDDTGVAIALVSHDPISVDYATRVVKLRDGQISQE